jgi:hypothetical protein
MIKEEYHLSVIQSEYDEICEYYQKLKVKAIFKMMDDCAGKYAEIPFRKIYLDYTKINSRVIYHELCHHLNPKMMDGKSFELEVSYLMHLTQLRKGKLL